MKISIVITSYNKADFIRQSIESALRQESVHEVIVVDDASTDASEVIIKSMGVAEFLRNPINLGVMASTRIGIERAIEGGCQFVALLDGDDILAPDTIEHYAFALRETGADAIYSKAVRDRHIDMRKDVVPCDVYAEVDCVVDPIPYHFKHPLSTTAVCGRPTIMVQNITDQAGVQDYQIAFSICYNSAKVALSKAVTHYCSVAQPGKNISADAVTMLTASVIIYMNTYPLVVDRSGFEKYQYRAFSRCIRIRRHSILPPKTRILLYVIAPFRKLCPFTLRQKIIEQVFREL